MSLNINCTERTYGTEVFAGSASYATFGVDRRTVD